VRVKPLHAPCARPIGAFVDDLDSRGTFPDASVLAPSLMAIVDLDAVILAAVAQLTPDAYGVAVRARAGELLNGKIPSVGSTHLTLSRLERAGLLRARVGAPTPIRGGRAKRVFSLTPAGVRALNRARRQVDKRAALLAPDWRPS